MIRRAGWVLIVIAAIACKERKEPTPYVAPGSGSGSGSAAPSEAGRLFTEAEITALLDDLAKRLESTAKRTCPAPQVAADPVPGKSAELIVELFEGTGDLAACMKRLDELSKTDLKDAVKARSPEVLAFDKDCGGTLAAKVLAAAARTDGCSPYQVGVKSEPKEMIKPIRIAHVISLHARELAAKGDVGGALALSTSGLRIFQDLTRGHVTYITSMIATASTEIVAASTDEILGSAKLTPELRTKVAAQLDALTSGMPRFADVQAGERDSMDIHFGAAQLMPDTWTPPGGWNEDLNPRKAGKNGKDTFPTKRFGHPRDEAAVLLVMTAETSADQQKACPQAATYAQCHAGLVKLGSDPKPAPEEDLAKLYAGLSDAARSGDAEGARKQIRGSIVAILKSIAQPAVAKYNSKIGLTLARLAQLRIHVEALGTCDQAKLAALASPPVLGAPLDVTVNGTTVEVRPPAFTDDKQVWTFACAK